MPHVQEIPATERVWEHLEFMGRRIGTHDDGGNPNRYWGIIYAPFASQEDADDFPASPPLEGSSQITIRVRGSLVDRFFWDPTKGASGQYTQTEAQVGALLNWFFTGNPTATELALTENMELARRTMVGTALFDGAIVVTQLPAERAPEEE